MRKWIIWLSIIILALLAISAIGINKFIPESVSYSEIRKSVVPLLITDGEKDEDKRQILGSGSGIIIKKGFILTVAHLIPEPEIAVRPDGKPIRINKPYFIYVTTPAHKLIIMKVEKVDTVHDLLLLSGDVNCPCVDISKRDAIIDETTYNVGFPFFLKYELQIVTTGKVQGYTRRGLLSTTTTAAPGSSGGASFIKNNGRYELIGVIDSIALYHDDDNNVQIQPWLSFDVSLKNIKQFLLNTKAI